MIIDYDNINFVFNFVLYCKNSHNNQGKSHTITTTSNTRMTAANKDHLYPEIMRIGGFWSGTIVNKTGIYDLWHLHVIVGSVMISYSSKGLVELLQIDSFAFLRCQITYFYFDTRIHIGMNNIVWHKEDMVYYGLVKVNETVIDERISKNWIFPIILSKRTTRLLKMPRFRDNTRLCFALAVK